MKWFLALNYDANNFADYAQLVKVAVHSALRYTSLRPHLLYDGPACPLIDWLDRRNVTVIGCRSFVYEPLAEIARQRANPQILAIGAGAFLRAELPAVARNLGIDDEFVLYTDVDVMFLAEVADYFSKLRPRYFAVGPELNPKDFTLMNTGVMLMNLPAMFAEDQRFRTFVTANLASFCADNWDEAAYRYFYRTPEGVPLWDPLPVEYNFKPYWGKYDLGRIIHFHGPKPQHLQRFNPGPPPPELEPLRGLMTNGYPAAVASWTELLAEAEAK